jgi:cell division protein FtsA
MKSDPVVVLDLGSTKVTALSAQQSEEGVVDVLGVATAPCKGVTRGVVTDLDEASVAVDSAVRRLQQQLGTELDSFIVSVAGTHLEGVNAQGLKPIVPKTRHITNQDVLEVINHSRAMMIPPDREQIQALPREFNVDGQRGIQRPVGLSGGTLEVTTYVVTGQRTHIQNTEKAIEMAGKRVEQMVLAPLASGIGVLTPEEIELGTGVIDIGGGKTGMAVFTNGSIAFSTCLPVGSMHVTSDLSKLLKTTPDEAERLKVNHGGAFARIIPERDSVHVMQLGQTVQRPMQRMVLCEIIESRMREIAQMVRQQIEKNGFLPTLPGGIVLTGGGAQMPGTVELFEDVLKHVRVRVAEPEMPVMAGPGMATAVGLAQYALQCDDDLGPTLGHHHWRERVRSLWTLVRGK